MIPDYDRVRADSSVNALEFEEYRRLTREHLGNLPGLLTGLTGVDTSVVWAPIWPRRWVARDLPTWSGLCRRLTGSSPSMPARCRDCRMRHLALTLQSGPKGHNFVCRNGVRNSWFPLVVRACVVGVAFVQVLNGNGRSTPASQNPVTPGAPSPDGANGARRRQRGAARFMAGPEFRRVARLLQLVFQHAQASVFADLRNRDLARARRVLLEFPSTTKRLREVLRRAIPTLGTTVPVLQAGAQARRIARVLLDSIYRDYSKPITLQECAAKLGLNVSYVSHVFSRAVGMPFKRCLTQRRIEKARELLGDFTRSVSEVAYAVGYASENRFRLAFRGVTGLSPRLWREALRTEPPQAASSSCHPIG